MDLISGGIGEGALLFLVCGEHILLAKKMKKIGKGQLNGYGGGIEIGETPETCVVREIEEESRNEDLSGICVLPIDLQKVAVGYFHNRLVGSSVAIVKIHIFFTEKWQGKLRSTDEMKFPAWYKKDHLPFMRMMPADSDWLPIVLSGKNIIFHAYLSENQTTLYKKTKIVEVSFFRGNE